MAVIVFDNSISQNIFFNRNLITIIIFNNRIIPNVFFDCFLSLIDYRIFVTILDRINTIALHYMGS